MPSAKDVRLLEQSTRALLRVSDWLSDLDEPMDGEVADDLGYLIHRVEEAQEGGSQ